MVEYGLLVALIALVAIVGVTLLGTNLNSCLTPWRAPFKTEKPASPLSDFPRR